MVVAVAARVIEFYHARATLYRVSNSRRTFVPVCYRQGRKSPYVCSQPQRSVDEDPHRPVRRTGTLYNAVPCRGAGVPWAPLDFEVPSRSFFRLLNFLTGCNLKSEPQIHQVPYSLDLNETSKEPDRNLKGTSRNLKSPEVPYSLDLNGGLKTLRIF